MNQLPWKPDKTSIINSTGFLPLIDSPNGLPKVKFVESTIFKIVGGGSAPPLRRRCGYQIPRVKGKFLNFDSCYLKWM